MLYAIYKGQHIYHDDDDQHHLHHEMVSNNCIAIVLNVVACGDGGLFKEW